MSGRYFYGSVSAIGQPVRKVVISNSRIITSTVDMNLQNITSVKDPLLSQDAATKRYVDSSADRITNEVTSRFSGYMVTLTSNEFVEVVNLKPGSYIVTVIPTMDGGPTATYSISKSAVYSIGFPSRITATPGITTLEQIELRWLTGSQLEVRKTGAGYDGEYIVNLNVSNISSLPNEPVLSSDTASKAYVDNAIKTGLEVKFGGIQVYLDSTEYTNVINLRPGSYIISVTAIGITGAPTAAFSLSKNSASGRANIVRTSSCLGNYTNEGLEVSWPQNSMIMLRKTGPGYSGTYLVDFNLKNFSSMSPVTLPTDSVTKDYVDMKLQELIDIKFGGEKVRLIGTSFFNVTNLRPGTYIVTINPLVTGGATASFSISKVSPFLPASSIVRLSSTDAIDTNESLDLTWPANQMLSLRKTGPFHDGEYLVDFNLKNIGTTIPSIPNDIATKEYVDETIKDNLDISFGGIKVTLSGTLYSNVVVPRLGSFFVSVTSLVNGGPTATFMLSKSNLESVAQITKITSASPLNSLDSLELEWPADSQLLLRKTGIFYDGDYLVDFNLKNFSSVPPVQIPSDIATKEYVENLFQQGMQAKFGGEIVSLIGTMVYEVKALKAGSYIVTVSPVTDSGPTATFSISKSSIYKGGTVSLITSSNSGQEALELYWPENSKLLLRKTGPGCDGEYIVDFNLKNTSQAPPAVIPSDIASKAYVDNAIQSMINFKFGGIIVSLNGTIPSEVVVLVPGSYLVSISSKVYGGPSATFSISKSVSLDVGQVSRITNASGYQTGEVLELSWPSNSKLLLHKTGIFHDGEYIIDLNLKNLGTTVEPVLPTDVATREFVEQTFQEKLDTQLSGVIVNLQGTSLSDVQSLKSGSYLVTVSSIVDGGPTASFLVSKASVVTGIGHVSKITSSDSVTGETLELLWPENSKLLLRKTGMYCDGEYLVDFNLRNNTVPPPEIPSDIVNKAYVDNTIQSMIDFKFGGIKVTLESDLLVQVCLLKQGSYNITVSPLFDGGPTACFSISKSSQYTGGVITRITSSKGISSPEELEMSWPESSQLLLRKTGMYYDGEYLVDFNLKNFSIPPPVIDSDIASKAYVDNTIQSMIDFKFGGITVTLTSDSFFQIDQLKPGSYNITVSPLFDGGPTACFSISKSSQYTVGVINRTTSLKGISSPEELEMSWPESSHLLLRKTGMYYDGEYLIDFNVKNLALPTPVIPSDIVNKAYVDNAIQSMIDFKFGGLTVTLTSDSFVQIDQLKPGSYNITVSPLFDGGPTACFSISKSSQYTVGVINRTTSLKGISGPEELEMSWPESSQLLLRKTGMYCDGEYLVDFNLKNFSIPTPVIPSDIVNKEYVDNAIQSMIDFKFGGLTVTLTSDSFVQIDQLKPGSYNITVSPLFDGGPTACFSISKSSQYTIGVITRVTSSKGIDSSTELEMSWPESSQLLLRKTSTDDNGEYLVDFN